VSFSGRKVHDKEDLKELGDVQSGLVTHCAHFQCKVHLICVVIINYVAFTLPLSMHLTTSTDWWGKDNICYFSSPMSFLLNHCSMASTIIQVYLKQVLESFFHLQSQVRMCALEVVVLILRQGLVHPVQVSPHSPSTSLQVSLLNICVQMVTAWLRSQNPVST